MTVAMFRKLKLLYPPYSTISWTTSKIAFSLALLIMLNYWAPDNRKVERILLIPIALILTPQTVICSRLKLKRLCF